MIAIGIDIGLTGAVGAVDHRGLACVQDIPTVTDPDGKRIDGRALLELLRRLAPPSEPCTVVFEDVRPRPMGNAGRHGNTMHSQGSLMRSRGIVEAVLDIARMKHQTVQPQTWKRHFALLDSQKSEKEKKAASLKVARTLYPCAVRDLARVKDHNRAEALLIAHWGLKEAMA